MTAPNKERSPGAERAARYRANREKQQAELRAAAAWAPPLAGGPSRPRDDQHASPTFGGARVFETVPIKGDDPSRWSAVPLLPPDVPLDADGKPVEGAKPGEATPIVDDPTKAPPTPEEQAVKAKPFVALVVNGAKAGIAALAELGPLLQQRLIAAKKVKLAATLEMTWPEVTEAEAKGALDIVAKSAEAVAVKYGLLVTTPPDEVIVGAALAGGYGAKFLLAHLKAQEATGQGADGAVDVTPTASPAAEEAGEAQQEGGDWARWMQQRGAS